MNYDRVDYETCLGGLFTRTTMELYQMGTKFQYPKMPVKEGGAEFLRYPHGNFHAT